MEEKNKQIISMFLQSARKKMTCNFCGNHLNNNVCQCQNGHSVCRRCAVRNNKTCSNCKKTFFINRCIILDNFAECLLEAEKINTIERLTQLLECTVCYERITPDFKLCIVGHAVCHNCWTRMVVCPICNNNYSHITNKLLLDLLSIFPYRCNYHDRGCKIMGCHIEIVKHELRCQHREFYCQVRKCFWKGGTERNLVTHVKCMHQRDTSSSETVKLLLNIFKIQHNMAECKTHFVTYNRKHFWQHFYCADGRIKFVTLMLGSPDEAKEYKVVVSGNSTSKTYDIFSDDNLDINICFNKQHPIAHDITHLVTQKLMKGQSGELMMVNECKVTIQKTKPLIKMCDLVSMTIFGGFVMYLLLKGNR